MKTISSILVIFSILVMLISSSAVQASANDADSGEKNKHIKSVTAITEVFGDGQKVSAVAIEYDKDVVNAKLDKSAFTVEGRTVAKVYANSTAAKAVNGTDGPYVIIELVKLPQTSSVGQGGGPGGTGGQGGPGGQPGQGGPSAQGGGPGVSLG